MSDEQHIGNDKSRYLNTPKRTDVGHRSGLANLKSPPRIKKLFTLHNGRKLEAEHVTVDIRTLRILRQYPAALVNITLQIS